MEYAPVLYYLEVTSPYDTYGGFHKLGSDTSGVQEAFSFQPWGPKGYRAEWKRKDSTFGIKLWFYEKEGEAVFVCEKQGLKAGEPIVFRADVGAYKNMEIMIAFTY